MASLLGMDRVETGLIPLKTAVERLCVAFLSGGRDARPPIKPPFFREKEDDPGTAERLLGANRHDTRKVTVPTLFSPSKTRPQRLVPPSQPPFSGYPDFFYRGFRF